MILERWAEQFLHAAWTREAIDLHVKDSIAAFLTGAMTRDGRALASLYGRHASDAAAAASAIARLSECDDIHLPSCVTPGAIVIPVALSAAQNGSVEDFHRAIAAGYAAGICLGSGIGGAKALAGGVWPTLLAAPLMAAVTASCAKGHDAGQLSHAMALALSGASGRVGRPMGAPSGRWFALAQAVAKGLRASEAAGSGFRGDLGLVSRAWLRAEAGHDDVDAEALESAPAPSMCEVGFKPFAIARQAANAVAAFQRLLSRGLDANAIEAIEVFVPAMNVALLSRPIDLDDRLSRLSHMGYQLAAAALCPDMLYNAERRERPDIALMEFARRVSVVAAPDLDVHLPQRWGARVVVKIGDVKWEETLIEAPFDWDASGLAETLNGKWRSLLRQCEDNVFDDALQGNASDSRALLWQIIERRVSIADEARPQA